MPGTVGEEAPGIHNWNTSIPLAYKACEAPAMSVPTTPGSRSERADARRNREAVIETALDVLATRPDASMEEIASAAGLGRTTVYRHFPTREDLVRSLFVQVVVEARELMVAVIAEGDSAEETIRAMGPAMVSVGQRFRFLHQHQAIGTKVFEAERAFEEDPVRIFLKKGIKSGELRGDVEVSWMQATITAVAIATTDEIIAGRVDPETGGAVLGEMLASALVNRLPGR
jgi:AcrR family transcriptional regulator